MTVGVDFGIRYVIAPDLVVMERDPCTLQIGTEPPRRMLITDAPPGARSVLARLDGSRSLGDAVAMSGDDPVQWEFLAADLIAAEILIPASTGRADPRLTSSRIAALRRYGARRADRILVARADAVAVVDGVGPLADRIANLLVESGVGTVHQQARLTGPGGAPPVWRHHAVVPQPGGIARIRHPAPQVLPSLLITTHAPGPAQLADLMVRLIPHLRVTASAERTVVGPLVVPARSACLNCLDHYRRDADPGDPAGSPDPASAAPPTTTALAAACAVDQALLFLDGQLEPDTIDTTIEYAVGSFAPRFRNWSTHAACGCRRFALTTAR